MEEEAPRDVLGRRKRVYRHRIHPMQEFTEVKFQARYRLSKAAVQYLLVHYGNYVMYMGQANGGGISLEDRFCLALRYFATGGNFSVIGDYQGVSKSTVSRCVHSVAHFLYRENDRWIVWPHRPVDKLRKAVEWHQMYGHPRVLGAVDGCHVAVRCPSEDDGTFINRHGWHSINVMMICDAQKAFIHVDPTWAGSVGDGFIFNQSEVNELAENRALDPFFLLGDSGYGNRKNLFIPVAHPVTQRELDYNRWHRRTRAVVEQSFGLLKQRWRCLDAHGGYLYHDPERCGQIVMACSVLHNVAIEFGVPILPDNDVDAFRNDHVDPGQPPHAPPPGPQDQQYVDRTNFIYDRF